MNPDKKMVNPWLEISNHDYENHMIEVGQAQVLNKLTKDSLEKYKPEKFALLGCSTGNGLEHVQNAITKDVIAIDINPAYLKIANEKFRNKIHNFKTYNLDIQHDELTVSNVDLFFTGLVLEYVDPEKTLTKIIRALNKNGKLVVVIQKNKNTSFVSKTKYKSLEKLSEICNEVDENKIREFIESRGMELVYRSEIELTKSKSFILLEYKLKD